MIVYKSTKTQFRDDVFSNNIEAKILAVMQEKMHRTVAESEVRSWKNSLQYMDRIVEDKEIPSDSSVAIEYGIPQSSKRIDFIIAGMNAQKKDSVVIVELKQWESVECTEKDAIVKTFVGGSNREVEHPSYQAWTYSMLLQDYNTVLHDGSVEIKPCAYLHNCSDEKNIRSHKYSEYTDKAPVFIRDDAVKLRQFIKSNIRYGDKNEILYKIDNGRIKPSKKLADALSSMLAGNQEFIMIDEQKLIFESVLESVRHSEHSSRKEVFIIQGGPGTGKSVLAVNLLVRTTGMEKNAQYISKNSAPREVFFTKLTGSMKKSHIKNIFKGSGGYHSVEKNCFDVLMIDEAHRLTEKSGMFSNRGENQIKEIIHASRVTVFFVDNDQLIHFKDIGRSEEIEKWAHKAGASITHFDLKSQFRCNGSTAYTSWLDNVLNIRDTANFELDRESYDFRVLDDPNELRKLIEQKNLNGNSARIVAGYCWSWSSKKDKSSYDIVMPEHSFKMKWNLSDDGMLWILKENSVSEAGCIHTCQGLELDYIGVIIGDDLIVRDGFVRVQADKRAKTDKSISGYKALLKKSPVEATKKIEAIIKNTYKTLMTRGQKGCYIYCTDKETREYFKSYLTKVVGEEEISLQPPSHYPHGILAEEEVRPYENAVPILVPKIAAGNFSGFQKIETFQWAVLPEPNHPKPGYFICQVIGDSMNKRIPNGAWCLFREDLGGSRGSRPVLVQHSKIMDPELGGQFTVKMYHSTKIETADGWKHTKIVLRPDSYFTHYKDIVLVEDDLDSFKVIGEFISVIG